jgi:nitrate/nitrite transporter NarK
VALTSAAAVLFVGALAWLVVDNDPSDKGLLSYAPSALRGQATAEIRHLLKGIKNVFAYRNTWLVLFAQGGIVGPILAFTGLWGPPFMRARFGLSSKTAAAVSSVMIICWAIASPICGAFSDKISRRKPVHLSGCLISTAGWITMFYASGLQLPIFVIVAALTSLASGAVVIGFATTKESVPVQYLGTIAGLTNIGNMIGPTLLQPGIGWVMDRMWSGGMAGGVRTYNLEAFQTAFLLMIAWSVLACVLLSLTRETYCRQIA